MVNKLVLANVVNFIVICWSKVVAFCQTKFKKYLKCEFKSSSMLTFSVSILSCLVYSFGKKKTSLVIESLLFFKTENDYLYYQKHVDKVVYTST